MDDMNDRPGGCGPSRIDHEAEPSDAAETSAQPAPQADSDKPTGQAGTGQSGAARPDPPRPDRG